MTIEERFGAMSLEQKVAQMIIVRGEEYADRIGEMAAAGQIGGIGAVAIPVRDLEGMAELTNQWRKDADQPVLFYIDAECGAAQVFPFATRLPPMMALGASGDPSLAAEHARVVASEVRALGFGIVANPSLDVNINPKNPIICTRAFSDDTDQVIRFARAYIHSMQKNGVIPCGKHYPGHGDTATDSHIAMPEVHRSRTSLMECELRPYREIGNEMWGVMTAHIYYPALMGEGEGVIPATMSRTVIHDLLRGELGYQNLIVSDSLTMKGIKDRYGLDAAIGAINAGHDLILQDYASDPLLTFERVCRAARDGKSPLDRIDESVRRILSFKERIGILENPLVDPERVRTVVGCAEHRAVAERIADASITQLEGEDMPLSPGSAGKVLVIATVGPEEEQRITDIGESGGKSSLLFAQAVCARCDADVVRMPEEPERGMVDELLARAQAYDTVIFASFVRTVSYKITSGMMAQEQERLIRSLAESGKRFVLAIFGSPYVIAELPQLRNLLLAYGDDRCSIGGAVKAIFGELTPTGRLPVTIDTRYPRGYAFHQSKVKLTGAV